VHTIEQALLCGCFQRVLVSTEDEEIADVARGAGAEVHIRDVELASDEATVADVCLSVLAAEEAGGRTYGILACLYATAPLRRATDIAAVVALLERPGTNFAMAVTTFVLAPHQALRFASDGSLTPMWPDLVNVRAADLGHLVVDNGSTYAVRVSEFRTHQSFYGPGLAGYVMPRERSVDIDVLDDYDLACWYGEKLKL
jgi:CMP-N-acetylneuraminic acid synthetase